MKVNTLETEMTELSAASFVHISTSDGKDDPKRKVNSNSPSMNSLVNGLNSR